MTLPTFAEFFRAVQDGERRHDPFPWQERLAERVVSDGWPTDIGVPTGLGKTTCLDIGVWAMAVSEDASTRLWYVVNRRLLVDAAHDHARLLEQRLRDAQDGPLAAVADALRARAALGVDDGGRGVPLHVARLRGGVPLDASAPDPSQPTLLLATVPMFGSRLLLRGYGVSRGMRPIGAAHAGTDATVLLDEAHLARPLVDLLDQLAECDPGDPTRVLPASRARPRLVSLTATGREGGDRLDLDGKDRAHAVVRRRLDATRPTTLVETTERKLPRALAQAAVDALADGGGGSTAVVFVNTAGIAPEVARHVRSACEAASLEADVLLLTGRLRDPDAEEVRARLLADDHGVRSGWAGTRPRPLVVVATQTLEVGADLDFEHLVTECAGVRALVQRLGRLNRLGQRNDVASAVVVHAADRRQHPVYGDEVAAVWERLRAAEDAAADGVVDLGPQGIGVLGDPADVPARTPSLLPHHLWEWTKTSLDQTPSTPVEPFLSGVEEPRPSVSVLWRWWVPPAGLPVFPRPRAEEVLELPLWEVREFLENCVDRDVAAQSWCRVDPDGLQARPVAPERLAPGDTVVLDARLGGYTAEQGWDPTSRRPVEDLTVLDGFVPLPAGPTPLPTQLLPEEVVAGTPTDDLLRTLREVRSAATAPAEEDRDDEVPDLLAAIPGLLGAAASDSAALAGLLAAWGGPPQLELVGPATADAVPVLVPPPRRRTRANVDVRVDAFEDLSFDQTSTSLHDHLGSVGAAARRIATALHLPDELVRAVELAGALHDVGKADRRFQGVLDPEGASDVVLAKSTAASRSWTRPPSSGWPRGGRHEELSGRAVRAWFERHDGPADLDRDLVLHLVVSHHGHGRPLVPPVRRDPFGGPVALPVDGTAVEVDGDLSNADWDQPERFRRLCERYGTWGLALLESVVRQADHAASAAVRQEEGR